MSGVLYGVGVGPGDPELMTLKAVRIVKECPVIAVPQEGKEKAVSYKIAAGAVPGLDEKTCISLSTPMTKDLTVLNAAYRKAAEQIAEYLEQGLDVAYLTLGDPTIYCTYIYVQRFVEEMGYHAQIVNGVPSFCAVGAELSDSLVDRSEQLHVIPSSYDIEKSLHYPGTKILMKAASKIVDVKAELKKQGLKAEMVENCGMETQKIYRTVEEIPDQASYFSIVVVRGDAE